jgi:predicted site-specific integrase-resolvase
MKQSFSTEPPIQALQVFCERAGIAPITAWRMRKRGWLPTINIAGRRYVTSEGVAEFKRRAVAGDFSKKHIVPMRVRSVPGSAGRTLPC